MKEEWEYEDKVTRRSNARSPLDVSINDTDGKRNQRKNLKYGRDRGMLKKDCSEDDVRKMDNKGCGKKRGPCPTGNLDRSKEFFSVCPDCREVKEWEENL